MDSELVRLLHDGLDTVPALARIMNVSTSTVYRWAQNGMLKTTRKDGAIKVLYSDNQDFIRKYILARFQKPEPAYVPIEIKRYNKWHQILDGIAWLLKISYSTKDEIRRKHFRLDKLYANYLKLHKIEFPSLRHALSARTPPNRTGITDDLKRGWYNELAFVLPLKHSTLGLSFHDVEVNKSRAVERFVFPSWRITAAYYAIYFHLRSIVLQKQANLRLQEHGTTIAAFKYNALAPLSQTIWQFPFSIGYTPGIRFLKEQYLSNDFRHLKYRYCAHPQPPRRSPSKLIDFIYETFRRSGRKRQKPIAYTIFDYLHDFRVWANYIEIDNLLSLTGTGYKSFLDQNLSLILFFMGGFAELSFISAFGEDSYVESLRQFLKLVVSSEALAEDDLTRVPHYQRLQIYQLLGLIRVNFESRFTPDINAVNLTPDSLPPTS